jgi:hypothetical protein
MGTGCRSCSITSMGSRMTTGSRSCESFVPTVRLRSTRTVDGTFLVNAPARVAGGSSPRDIFRHRFCSQRCAGADNGDRLRGIAHPERRKVPRPSYEALIDDWRTMSLVAVGRQYGVSDNAVRKWLRWYEAEQGREEAT